MPSVKFIHAADLHLDTPFKGLSVWNAELSRRLKDATFKSFSRIADLCIEKKVDFLVIAGDVFDSENKSLASQLRFFPELKRLSDKGIPVYIVCGNHDPFGSWLDASRLPENVCCFSPASCDYMTFKKGEIPHADIHGISFGDSKVKLNLAEKYKRAPAPAPFSIAVLHGSVGETGPHVKYAPFRVEDVLDKGFDYWALGHIHKRNVIREANPAIVYPGNPQGRDFGETGRKGCYLVTINDGQAPDLEFIPTQLIRFESISIDISGIAEIDELSTIIRDTERNIEDFDENTNFILRISLSGRTALHEQLNKAGETDNLLEIFNEGQLSQDPFVWIDRIDLNTRPNIEPGDLKNGSGFPSEVMKAFDKLVDNKENADNLFQLTDREFSNALAKKYAGDLTDEARSSILERARTILLDQLITGK